MAVVVALLLALVFGGADQYLGSLSAYPWAHEVSLLSAPWLVLAFIAGWSQRDPRRAALLGLACTLTALLGYGLMTLSPVEGAQLTTRSARGFLISEGAVFAGGLITGPLFGWLGNRWRMERRWVGALAAAAAVCLEPFAHEAAGDAITFRPIELAEIAAGLAMAIYIAVETRSRRGDSNPGPLHYE